MKKRITQAFHGLIALLAVAVALLEAPELVTLTNNVANDPAPIGSTQQGLLQSASFAASQSPTTSTGRQPVTVFPLGGCELSPCPSLAAPKAGRDLLRLLVLQRK
jgi:hypothetical protein